MNHPLDIIRSFRPNQWTKNLVVLAAFCFAFGDRSQSIPFPLVFRILTACGLFCLASSGIYIINDIRDREGDRAHPTKKFRPIAAGKVTVPIASIMATLLLVIALTGAVQLSLPFGSVVAAYIAMQIAYSAWLKTIALVDVFVIAIGFVLRALGGGVAINVTISPWLLVCAFLLALFLALCKRRHEKILFEHSEEQHRVSLENYDRQLLDQLIAIVSAATIVSYSVYTLAPDTLHKFGTPLLSLTIPFVIFGIFRYLDLVYRKDGGGRPEKILLTDATLIIDLALYGLCVLGIFVFTHFRHPAL